MGEWGSGKVKRTCRYCNKEFEARHDRPGIYCSRSCGSSGKPKINLRIGKRCAVCNEEFIIKRYRQESALYCSVECRRKRMPKKESHPNWKGGIARTWLSKKIIKQLIKDK